MENNKIVRSLEMAKEYLKQNKKFFKRFLKYYKATYFLYEVKCFGIGTLLLLLTGMVSYLADQMDEYFGEIMAVAVVFLVIGIQLYRSVGKRKRKLEDLKEML